MTCSNKIELIDETAIDELTLPAKPKARRAHYVDNAKLSEEMTKWRRAIDAAKEAGLERPRMPEYVGKCVMLIAENTAKLQKFSSYTWAEEMIGDAVITCCQYLHNFNPDAVTKSGKVNAFSYITRYVERAFIHRIELENRQLYYKNKSFVVAGGVEAFGGEDFGPDIEAEQVNKMMTDMVDRAYEYEEKQKRRLEEQKLKNASKTAPAYDMFNIEDEEHDELSDGDIGDE